MPEHDELAAVGRTPWGHTREGAAVDLYTLRNDALNVTLTTYGAGLVSVFAPDRDGVAASVVLGYADLATYEGDNAFLGAIVGRYGNRLAKGRFTLDGEAFQVPANNGVNALHGGPQGFDRKVWTAREIASGMEFEVLSADGDNGFPGELSAKVRYTLRGSSLQLDYRATTTKPTIVNLTNHAYFNLAGEGSGDVLAQKLRLNAERYTPVDEGLIPTGELRSVEGTPFDFRERVAIGERIGDEDEQLQMGLGYDHNFVLQDSETGAGGLRVAAEAVDPASGRTLTVTTTEPGVQFYSGNQLKGRWIGLSGKPYEKHAGFCLETQHFPDSPNHPHFPSAVLRPGETLRSSTIFTFGVQGKGGERV